MIKIQNDVLTANISPLGAELQSLRLNHNQHELIWQRDPSVWSGSAPILFPIVGRLIEGHYILDGQTYTMPIHGIVRAEPWTVVEHAETHVTLEINDSEASRQCYPFRWKLVVRFELTERRLAVQYSITNLDSRTLYFSLGSHPAFNLDFGSSQISDYVLRTDNHGDPWQRHKIMDGKLSKERYDVDWRGRDLPLSESTFDESALVFTGIRCRQLLLLNTRDPDRSSLIPVVPLTWVFGPCAGLLTYASSPGTVTTIQKTMINSSPPSLGYRHWRDRAFSVQRTRSG